MMKEEFEMNKDTLKVELCIKADGVIKALNELNQSIEDLKEKLNTLKGATLTVNSCDIQANVDIDTIIKKISEELEKEFSRSARARHLS